MGSPFPMLPTLKAELALLPSRAPQHHSHAQGWVPGTRLQGPRPVAGSASPLLDHTAGQGPGAGREGSLLSCHMS